MLIPAGHITPAFRAGQGDMVGGTCWVHILGQVEEGQAEVGAAVEAKTLFFSLLISF